MSAGRPVAGGFTMLEVLASILVLTISFGAAIGMVLYGIQIAKQSMGRATALATAMTVAVDEHPLQPLDGTPSWTVAVPGTTSGYLNGYYVLRTEGTPVVLATDGAGAALITAADVQVDVFETNQGRPLASYNQRLIRQVPAP
ncbi:MAG: hypothetical protein J0M02_09185 [Planctomycetes bacterium]|nr:hypothetical protein [Planctomycetota bacterium]